MSLFTQVELPDWYFVCLINSRFISLFVDNFINSTSHFQINDARQLPIIVPSQEKLQELLPLFQEAVQIKKSGNPDQDGNSIKLELIENKIEDIILEIYQIK